VSGQTATPFVNSRQMITGSSSETVELPVQTFIRIPPYVIFLGLPRG